MHVGMSARAVAHNMQANFVYMEEDWLWFATYLSRVARANGWTYYILLQLIHLITFYTFHLQFIFTYDIVLTQTHLKLATLYIPIWF
jgi:hypothetical protein